MKKLQISSSLMRALIAALAVMAFVSVSKATPYASCVTNNSGAITFYLNEGGGTVTVTYEDGSTNASYAPYHGTGTNLAAGQYSFSLVGHSSFHISVFKVGTGSPGVITSHSIGTTRGVAVNARAASPYFGRVYDVQGGAGVWMMNSDLSSVISTVQTAGVTTWNNSGTGTGQSPDWVSVAPDDYALVTDTSQGGASIYRIAPDFSSNQLLLGPVGETNGLNAGSHGITIGPALVTGSIAKGNLVLYGIDGNLNPSDSLQVYNIGAGPLPWTNAPSYPGIQIALAGFTADPSSLSGNEYPGLTMGPPPNSYIYGSTYRSGASWPFVSIADSTGTNLLWTSQTGSPPTGDWFLQLSPPGTTVLGSGTGLAGTSAVSPDGNYIVGVDVDNYFIICPLTNGIPDTSRISVVAPTSYSGNARGVAWDAADNIYLSSSGIGLVQEWTLGQTTIAVTGNDSTGTNGTFQLTTPSTTVSVVATTPQASQNFGSPIPGVFTITRNTTDSSGALVVNIGLSGTASNNIYTLTPSSATNGTITIPAGQTNVTLTVTPVSDNVPRATTTVILTLKGGTTYSAAVPFTDTVFIQNTGPEGVSITSTVAPSMYKAFSNDYGSFVLTRLGDINNGGNNLTISNFTYAGTAVAGVDFALAQPVVFAPGDATKTNYIFPLDPTLNYVGNKTIIVSVGNDANYINQGGTSTLTIIDNANPPATLLWSDSLSDPNDATNWAIAFGNQPQIDDYDVEFGYDLTSNNPNYGGNGRGDGIVAFPPNGASNVLRMTVNKNQGSGTYAAAGVNVYPTNVSFSGNYAVRFNMNLVQGGNINAATEGATFGVNHGSRGIGTNWWEGSANSALPSAGPWSSDGIWYWLCSDGGGASDGDYIEFTSITNTFPNSGWQFLQTGVFGSTSFANAFKNSTVGPGGFGPFTTDSSVGIPANWSPNAGANSLSLPSMTWCDVEMKQINGVVTLSVDKTTIFTYTNTTIWTNGTMMLGYNDPFPSVGNWDGAVYFSNIRVVRLGPPSISRLLLVPSGGTTNVVINFTTTDADDTIASFNLLSGGPNSLTGTIDTVTPATFTQLGTGAFQATTAISTNKSYQFYRIQHK